MSANELLAKVKALSPSERRKFFESVRKLQKGPASPKPFVRKKAVHWPDAAVRRRRIFGNKQLPNLVLLARDEERF